MSEMQLRQCGFNIAKNRKCDGCQRGLASMVYKCFDKKSSGGAAKRAWSQTLARRKKSAIKSEIIPKQQLAEQLHKTIIRKFIIISKVNLTKDLHQEYPFHYQKM